MVKTHLGDDRHNGSSYRTQVKHGRTLIPKQYKKPQKPFQNLKNFILNQLAPITCDMVAEEGLDPGGIMIPSIQPELSPNETVCVFNPT